VTSAGTEQARVPSARERFTLMGVVQSFSYLVGPGIALLGVGLLVIVLRWSHGPGRSVVARPARRGRADEYGLLVPVASPGTYIEGEILRRKLEDAAIRATLAMTDDGPRIMVFPRDENVARSVLTG
jgi:hypothetical protein